MPSLTGIRVLNQRQASERVPQEVSAHLERLDSRTEGEWVEGEIIHVVPDGHFGKVFVTIEIEDWLEQEWQYEMPQGNDRRYAFVRLLHSKDLGVSESHKLIGEAVRVKRTNPEEETNNTLGPVKDDSTRGLSRGGTIALHDDFLTTFEKRAEWTIEDPERLRDKRPDLEELGLIMPSLSVGLVLAGFVFTLDSSFVEAAFCFTSAVFLIYLTFRL
jgi:hypothetical protein